jgi:hypothetical protein
MSHTCTCTHVIAEHRVEREGDNPPGSCKLCECVNYQRADKPFIPRYTR